MGNFLSKHLEHKPGIPINALSTSIFLRLAMCYFVIRIYLYILYIKSYAAGNCIIRLSFLPPNNFWSGNMSGDSIFTPKPMARVQDSKGDKGPTKTYDYIIGDDDYQPNMHAGKADVSESEKKHGGKVVLELGKSSYRTGQPVKGKVTVDLGGPAKAESLIVAVWGQKVTTYSTNESGARMLYVSQRSVELCKSKLFNGKEEFGFQLPLIAPVPDIAANYRWYVGASLMLNEEEEVSDLVELKVLDQD